MKSFPRRIYPSFGKFWNDFWALMADWKQIRETMRSNLVSPAFRERLMLAVTGVNQCRYCLYGHSRQALKLGISQEELRDLCLGTFDQSPSEELPALLYAQHWAETSGEVDPEARESLHKAYGPSKSQAIEISLRLIQMGNLLGNSFDYVIYRVSFGRWGLLDEEKEREWPMDSVSH